MANMIPGKLMNTAMPSRERGQNLFASGHRQNLSVLEGVCKYTVYIHDTHIHVYIYICIEGERPYLHMCVYKDVYFSSSHCFIITHARIQIEIAHASQLCNKLVGWLKLCMISYFQAVLTNCLLWPLSRIASLSIAVPCQVIGYRRPGAI